MICPWHPSVRVLPVIAIKQQKQQPHDAKDLVDSEQQSYAIMKCNNSCIERQQCLQVMQVTISIGLGSFREMAPCIEGRGQLHDNVRQRGVLE